MKIIVNGKETECRDDMNLNEWLLENGYEKGKIAVEINESILPKAKYAEYILGPNDKLEIVSFVGGG